MSGAPDSGARARPAPIFMQSNICPHGHPKSVFIAIYTNESARIQPDPRLARRSRRQSSGYLPAFSRARALLKVGTPAAGGVLTSRP